MRRKVEMLHGIVPPIATPLRKDETVDAVGLERLVEYLLADGVHAIFVMGSTGEFAHLTNLERRRATEIVVETVNDRVPVLAGCSAQGTKKAILHSNAAAECGANYAVVTPPYYLPASQEEIVIHYQRFVEETTLPCVIYNIPLTTGSNVEPETAERILDTGRIAAMKDSSEDFVHFQRLIAISQRRDDFPVFQGSENNAGASLLMGASGAVLGIANLVPKLAVQLYEAAASGATERTRTLQRQLQRVRQIYNYAAPRQALKYALSLKGICGDKVCGPVEPLTPTAKRSIKEVLRTTGVLD